MSIKIPFSLNPNDGQEIRTVIKELDKDLKDYTVNLANVPYDYFVRGVNAKEAILNAIDEALDEGHGNNVGAARARLTVYGEWDCDPKNFHNDGSHSHNYS